MKTYSPLLCKFDIVQKINAEIFYSTYVRKKFEKYHWRIENVHRNRYILNMLKVNF